MILPIEGQRIELITFGCGNIPSYLVIWLPDGKVLIGGDILTLSVPFGFPPCPSDVITTTEELLVFGFDYLILGHGSVHTNREYGEKVLALQHHAVSEICRMHAEGLSENQISARLNLSPYDDAISDSDEAIEFFLIFGTYIQAIVGQTVREIEAK